MTQVGTGKYTYELIPDFPKLPEGLSFGVVSRVATDSRGRLYVFQRKDPPVLVFERDGTYVDSWGSGQFIDPHGIRIVDDVVYTTDRKDHVAMAFTLEGKLLQTLGTHGVHTDTGCSKSPYIVERAAGPFNEPTDMIPGPSGDLYVTDGYCNSRVHRFTKDGELVKSWGEPGKTKPGDFHLVHSVVIAPDGKLYVCDRSNRRVQIFTAEGQFVGMWTGMGGPNDIDRDDEGTFYICEQEADGNPAYICIRDGDGAVLAKWATRHAHGLTVDAHGDIYVGLTTSLSVDKYVRRPV
jgi:DNA-binding beta-propeller fold protein YncE